MRQGGAGARALLAQRRRARAAGGRRLERRAVGRAGRSSPSTLWTFPVLRDAEGTVGNDYRLTRTADDVRARRLRRIRSVLRGPQDASTLARAMASVRQQ